MHIEAVHAFCITKFVQTFTLCLFREGAAESKLAFFQGRPITFTQLNIHTWKLPSTTTGLFVLLSSSAGANGIRGLAQGPSEVEYWWGKQFLLLSPPTLILLVRGLNWRHSDHKLASLTIRPPLPKAKSCFFLMRAFAPEYLSEILAAPSYVWPCNAECGKFDLQSSSYAMLARHSPVFSITE